jgi:hypothetical protein
MVTELPEDGIFLPATHSTHHVEAGHVSRTGQSYLRGQINLSRICLVCECGLCDPQDRAAMETFHVPPAPFQSRAESR